MRDPTPTVRRIFGLYLGNQTPKKSPSEQQADNRRAKLWTAFVSTAKDLSKLTLREWDAFIEARRTGALDASGTVVPENKRQLVRDGTVAADLVFLKSVLNWATRWQDNQARYLMRENPARGFPIPAEKNPRRPLATQDRFEKVRAVADQVMTVVLRRKKQHKERSYLPEVLDLVNGTGRRISAILALRAEDLRLDQGKFGTIRFPADTDKTGKEWVVPISKEVRVALDRILVDRPVIGKGYLFPAVNDPSRPVAKEVVSAWLLKAEKLAGVPKQEGSLWHAYRRKWATERKHLPDVDVAAAGGWSEVNTLKQVYQQADQEGMYRVVSEPAVLRDVGA